MNAERFQRIKALFDSLAELAPEDRAQLLDQLQDHGLETRRDVQELLDSDAQVADHTARPLLRKRAAPPAAFDAQWIGRRIGAYVIERELGRGGMGSVFLANRDDGTVAQRVAIKVIRPERVDENTLARFRLECQVLAFLEHANIASLVDLGELEDGSPYVVMDYVEGVPITEYAQRNAMPLTQRLQLFLRVCDAVSHAHHNMIVHRDIKSSNVLVDRDGQPKLIDFGIAKTLKAQLGTVEMAETATRERFFTVHNVAPEQLLGNPTTVACDVYGLGVLLYELLTGLRPYLLDDMTPAQVERQLLEIDPPLPSRRMEVSADSERGNTIGARALQGDLDCIVMRCLRKRESERYDSVAALASDITCYLTGFPVRARRGTRSYRVRRFVQRNRKSLLAVATFAALSGVAAVTVLQQRQSTLEQRIRADQMTSLMQRALSSADPNQALGKDVTAREVFQRVAAQAEQDTNLNPQARATLLSAIADITLNIGEPKQAQRLQEAIDLDALDSAGRDAALQSRARTSLMLGEFEAAAKALQLGRAQTESPLSSAQWTLLEAQLSYEQDNHAEAQRLLLELTRDRIPDALKDDARLLLASSYKVAGQPKLSYDEYTRLLADQRTRLPAEHPSLLRALVGWIGIAAELNYTTEAGKASVEALRIADRLYGRHSVGYIGMLKLRRNVLVEDDYATRLAIQRDIMALTEELLGAEHPNMARENLNLGNLLAKMGDHEQADVHHRRAIEIGERAWQPTDMNLFIFHLVHASHLIEMGRHAEAGVSIDVALQNAEHDPGLKQYDIFANALLMKSVSVYALARTPANRDALLEAIKYAQVSASSGDSKESTQLMIDVSNRLGADVPAS